mmetsp:Transcript_16744/g.48154  ORF Transcript_16744/g.48154 Transcript_16744/m.48154 type:complete len:214 (-) Transcript_16744:535-1176(-)
MMPASLFLRLSAPMISTYTFPRSPLPRSSQRRLSFFDSHSISSEVIHSVSFSRFGSGYGRTRCFVTVTVVDVVVDDDDDVRPLSEQPDLIFFFLILVLLHIPDDDPFFFFFLYLSLSLSEEEEDGLISFGIEHSTPRKVFLSLRCLIPSKNVLSYSSAFLQRMAMRPAYLYFFLFSGGGSRSYSSRSPSASRSVSADTRTVPKSSSDLNAPAS